MIWQHTQFNGEYSNMMCVFKKSRDTKFKETSYKRKYIMSWETEPSNFFFMKFL